ncbi:MAG TPA: UDP-3-O-acyl-N-acetylglucosamine deacetylase, partial [Candidatus Polarisedimenticolaceae bacterium]
MPAGAAPLAGKLVGSAQGRPRGSRNPAFAMRAPLMTGGGASKPVGRLRGGCPRRPLCTMCASAGSTRTGAERRLRWRQTISRAVSLSGIALHTGREVRVRVLPAEPSSGIVFVRVDAGGVEIPATLEYAGPSFYATVLERDGVRVSTIEHLMAALYALQVDDARIELDGPEMPILDGSSLPFVEALLRAGPVACDVERLFIHIVRPIEVAQEEKTISVHPAAEYRVTYAIDFD